MQISGARVSHVCFGDATPAAIYLFDRQCVHLSNDVVFPRPHCFVSLVMVLLMTHGPLAVAYFITTQLELSCLIQASKPQLQICSL